MLTLTKVPDLLSMPPTLDTSPDSPQLAAPRNTPEPPTHEGSAPQGVNGNVENRGPAEITSDNNVADRAPVLLDRHIPDASADDWRNVANNASGH
jgi:hypothetical protein